MNKMLTTVVGALAFLGLACGPEQTTDKGDSKPEFVIGTLLYEDGAAVKAHNMAIDDVNASGVLPVKLVALNVTFGDNDDRTQLARQMFTSQKVKAIGSSWSSTGLRVLRLTNTPEFQNIVQCSSGSTNTTINDMTQPDVDGQLMADKNDTFYRAVANDKRQALLVWNQIKSKSKAGIYFIDDPYGQSFRAEIASRAAGSLRFDDKFPETFSATAEKAKLDAILAANARGDLESLVLVGLGDSGGAILKYLVEARPPFHGQIIGPDGLSTDSVFTSQGAAFAQWLHASGNSLSATLPEGLGGVNSKEWASRYAAKFPSDAAGASGGSTSYDCVYVFAMALMYGQGTVSDTTLRDNMPKLKASQLGQSPVTVPPSREGLLAAKEAIDAGKRVRLDGASGVMEFDGDGDSIHQLYAVQKVAGTGPFTWAPHQVWNPMTNTCLSGCN